VADNTTLNTGAGGDTIATDDIAGVKHQLVKLEYGVLDSATLVSTTNPLPVDQTNTTVADGGVLPAKGVQVGGTDGSVFQVLSTDNAGRLNANINGTVTVDTELPAAAALADAAANPTVPGVGGFGMFWNGATWDRVPGSAANGLTANLKALNGTAIDTNSGAKSAGTQRVILASDQTVVPVSDNAGSLTVDATAATFGVNNSQVSGTAISVSSGVKDAGTQRVILASDQTVVPISDNAGSLTVDAPVGTPAFVRLSDGAAAITALPVTDNAGSLTVDAPVGTPVFTTPTPSTTGGWSQAVFAALTNTKTLIKASAGTFGGYYTIYNPNSSVAYVQIFDVAATASVTLGTTVRDGLITIPATSAANLEMTNGVHMTNGIVIACTTTATGSTAPGTGLDGTLLFK
jgi:hypothetical protein